MSPKSTPHVSIAIDDIGCSDSASFIPFLIFDNSEEKSQRRIPSLLFGPFQNLFISLIVNLLLSRMPSMVLPLDAPKSIAINALLILYFRCVF